MYPTSKSCVLNKCCIWFSAESVVTASSKMVEHTNFFETPYLSSINIKKETCAV